MYLVYSLSYFAYGLLVTAILQYILSDYLYETRNIANNFQNECTETEVLQITEYPDCHADITHTIEYLSLLRQSSFASTRGANWKHKFTQETGGNFQ